MDLQETSNNQIGNWTNEKHFDFLESMESSFVKTLFENGCHSMQTYATDSRRRPRLDRYLPDSSESTLDLENQRRKRKITQTRLLFADILDQNLRRKKKPKRRRSSQSSDTSSQDLVVPQLQLGSCCTSWFRRSL